MASIISERSAPHAGVSLAEPAAIETDDLFATLSSDRGNEWFGRSLVVVTAGLAIFALASAANPFARRGLFHLGKEARPPIYGFFRPGFATIGLVAVGLAVAGGILAFLVARRGRIAPVVLLAGGITFLLAFSAAVAIENGRPRETLNGLTGGARARDAAMAAGLSPREVVRRFPAEVGRLNVHSASHPPGRLVVEGTLRRAFSPRVAPVAAVFALWSVSIVVSLWFLARRFAGDRAATLAVVLFVAAPGPVLFTVVSHDARDAAMLAAAMALLAWGGVWKEGRLLLAALGGFVLGLTSFLTYAVAFAAIAAAILCLWSRRARDALVVLAVAAGGGIAALALLRLTFGFDLFEAYRASHAAIGRECSTGARPCLNTARLQAYWFLGSPAAWLSLAGVPIAGLALRQLFLERPRYLLAVLAPLVVFFALPVKVTHIFPGEVERTLVWVYPYAAIAAGTALARWERRRGNGRPVLVGGLVILSAFQAILIEALYANLW